MRKRPKQWIALLAVGVLASAPTIGRAQGMDEERLEVPLSVRETAGVGRRDAPVSGGIPLPREAGITNTDRLRLVASDGIRAVDCQFTVLARWFGEVDDEEKAIRWVRLDFTADAPAGGSAHFFLQEAPPARTGAAATSRPASPLLVTDTADRLIVHTGAMTAAISKRRLTILEEVFIDADGDGRVAEQIVKPDQANGIVIARSLGSQYYSTQAGAPTIEVEERGPMVAVVRLTGSLRPGTHNGAYVGQSPDLDYLVRLYFYRDRSFVRAYVRIGYPDKVRIDGVAGKGDWVRHELKELALRTAVGLASAAQYTIGTDDRPLVGPLAAGETAVLYQDSSGGPNWGPAPGWPTRFRGFGVLAQGKRLGGGLRAPGWADLSDGALGLTVAVRRFWQEFPKALTLKGAGEVSVGLFPREREKLFQFDGGRRKSHEVLFYFHRGDAEAARSGAVAADFLSPLRAVAPQGWYRDAAGLGPYAVEDDELFGPYERLVGTIVASEDGQGTRHHEREVNDNYGWLNYGDTFLAGSKTERRWANNPLDLAYALLIQHLRRQTGSEAFFEEAMAMVRHQVEIDTYATPRDDSWLCWGTRGPDGGGSTDHNGLPSLDHTSIKGVVLYYYLTGEPWAREAALEWGRWVAANQASEAESGGLSRVSEVRALGPIIDGLCDLYMLTGDDTHLSLAQGVVRQMVMRGLSAEGFLLSQELKGRHKSAVSPPSMAEVCAAVGRYVRLKRDQRDPDVDAERALGEMLGFLARETWTRTIVRIGNRQYPAALATVWFPDDKTAQYDRLAVGEALEAFGVGYLLWGDDRPTYLGLVRDMYEAAFRTPPASVYYRPGQSGAASEMAHLIRYGQAGMYLIQGTLARISFLPAERNLTKHSTGAYTVRVRLRNIPAGVVPQLDYALDNTVYAGWRDMRPVPREPAVWELEVPDLGWQRLAAHRLNVRVHLLGPDRRALGRPYYKSELIDSLDLPPAITPAVSDIEVTAGREATIELRRYVRDNEDQVESLTWSVADVDETLLSARIDAARDWLILRPLREAGSDTITIIVRDTVGNVARQAVRVTIVPPAK